MVAELAIQVHDWHLKVQKLLEMTDVARKAKAGKLELLQSTSPPTATDARPSFSEKAPLLDSTPPPALWLKDRLAELAFQVQVSHIKKHKLLEMTEVLRKAKADKLELLVASAEKIVRDTAMPSYMAVERLFPWRADLEETIRRVRTELRLVLDTPKGHLDHWQLNEIIEELEMKLEVVFKAVIAL